jgi:hypothetical protein
LYYEIAERLKNLYVFNISFENGTPITEEEMENPWNAVGIRMLHQLLDKPIDYFIIQRVFGEARDGISD